MTAEESVVDERCLKEGFDGEFSELLESCDGYLSPFHKGAIIRLMNKKRFFLESRTEDYEDACHHILTGLVDSFLRKLEELDLTKKEEIKIVLAILQKIADKK